jgi:signal transduction histidine kinase
MREKSWEGRKRYLAFDDGHDAANLRAIGDRVDPEIDDIVSRFYEHIRAFPELARLLDAPGRVEALRDKQRGYLRSLLRGPHDERYLGDRERIGTRHEELGVDAGWYLGACALYARLLLPYAIELAGGDGARAAALIASVLKAIFLDACVAVDTYLAASEAALARSEARFRGLVEHAPVAMVLHAEGRLLFANPAGLRLLAAMNAADVIGAPIAAFVAEGRPDGALPGVLAPGDVSAPVVVRLRDRLGAVHVVEAVSMGMTLEAHGVVLTTLRDVGAELRQRSSAAAVDRRATIGVMAASVMHEIGNPLSVMLVNVDALQQQLASLRSAREPDTLDRDLADLEDNVSDLAAAARQIAQVVRDFRTIGHPGGASRPVDLARVIDTAARLARAQVEARADLDVAIRHAPRVLGRESQLCQVVINLLTNAAQAAREDGRRHTVSVELDEVDGQAHLVVRDTGAGIAPEHLPYLFEPFFTTKPEGEGSGLGLAVVADIVREHGGSVRAESRPGAGTSMIVELPALAATPATP